MEVQRTKGERAQQPLGAGLGVLAASPGRSSAECGAGAGPQRAMSAHTSDGSRAKGFLESESREIKSAVTSFSSFSVPAGRMRVQR